MTPKRIIKLVTGALLLLAAQHAQAQCCGAGNPISVSQGDAVMKKSQMQIAVGFRHSYSNRYFDGSHASSVDFPGKIDWSGYDFLDLGLSYGLTRRLTVGTTIGYFIAKREDYRSELFSDVKSSGFGDLGLRASYTAFRNVRRGIEVSPFVMVKFPIGRFDCVTDGIKLPLAMQPSSGSFKYSLGVSASFNVNKLLFFTTFDQFEYSQRIKSKNFDYQYGALWNLNASIGIRAIKHLHTSLQLGYEDKGKAKEERMVLDGSEYRLLKLTPQLSGFYKDFQLSAGIDLPIWRHVGGIQMSNTWALQLNLAYNIKL